MRYMLLIHSEEGSWDAMSDEEKGKLMEAYGAFYAELEAKGAYRNGLRLRPSDTATTVKVRDGKTLTTDGPFVETKEQLGGFYEISAENLDEAVAWAAKIPSAAFGTVEVRPVWEVEG